MRIEHVALCVKNLERSREFFEKYFAARSSGLYCNPKTGFSSYFLSFEDGARLELMNYSDTADDREKGAHTAGYAHIAFSVGSRESVVSLTERLRADGYRIVGEPRTTGDGYFESVIADPEDNLIEITV